MENHHDRLTTKLRTEISNLTYKKKLSKLSFAHSITRARTHTYTGECIHTHIHNCVWRGGVGLQNPSNRIHPQLFYLNKKSFKARKSDEIQVTSDS